MFFQHLHSVLEEPSLTTAKYESEYGYFAKYTSKGGAVAGVFSGLPSEVSAAVGFSPSWIQVGVTGGAGSASGAPAHSSSGAEAISRVLERTMFNSPRERSAGRRGEGTKRSVSKER